MKERRKNFWLLPLLLILLGLALYDSFFTVKESEQAVLTTFGKYSRTYEAGLHFKLPRPFQNIHKVPVRRTQKLELGYYQDSSGHYHDADDDNALTITGDMNVVDIDFFLEWRISDPVAWLFNSESPAEILEYMLASAVRSVVGTKTIDETLTSGKIEIQNEVKEKLFEKLSENPIGVQIIDLKINNSTPPTEEVSRAFRDVETAKQQKDTAINDANKYRNSRLPAARSKADQILRQAEGYKAGRIQEAEGERDRFISIYEQYSKYDIITAKRLYLETLSRVLSNVNLIIDNSGDLKTYLPLEAGQTPAAVYSEDTADTEADFQLPEQANPENPEHEKGE
ncbi:MAG: FtsH protease activity modulator HflK [Eubacteriales bacterium]|nr:FtsH protease activity modulator HflK [Eubacteriales bacterium]